MLLRLSLLGFSMYESHNSCFPCTYFRPDFLVLAQNHTNKLCSDWDFCGSWASHKSLTKVARKKQELKVFVVLQCADFRCTELLSASGLWPIGQCHLVITLQMISQIMVKLRNKARILRAGNWLISF